MIRFASLLALCALLMLPAHAQQPTTRMKGGTMIIGATTTEKIGFHGTLGTAQRAGAAQAALTDSTTGTASSTLAAGTGLQTVVIPILLPSLANGDVLTNYTPGFAFKVLAVDFAVSKAATTAAKAATLNLEIGTTNVTGGVVSLTSANSTPLGALVAGTAVTAANTGTNADTISIEAASVTAFVEGEGYLLIRLQNMDTANSVASLASLTNELRASLVAKGLIKGAP